MNIKTILVSFSIVGFIQASEHEYANRSIASVDDMIFVSPHQDATSILSNAMESLEIEIRRTLTEQGAMIEEAVTQPEQAGAVIASTSFGLVIPGGFPDLGVYDDDETVMHEPSVTTFNRARQINALISVLIKSNICLTTVQQTHLKAIATKCDEMQSEAQTMKDRLLRLCSLVRQPDVDLYTELKELYENNFARCVHIKAPQDVYSALDIKTPHTISHQEVCQHIQAKQDTFNEFDIRQLGYIFSTSEGKRMFDAYLQGEDTVREHALTMNEQQFDDLRAQAMSLSRIRDEITKIQRGLQTVSGQDAAAAGA